MIAIGMRATRSSATIARVTFLQFARRRITIAGGTPGLALNKRRALDLEAAVLLRSRVKHVDVETESLQSSAVSSALRTLAGRGVRCRLLVSSYELRQMRPTLASLEEIGVQ